MLPRNHPDRIRIAFDDTRLVVNAGLLLPVTLAQHLGLRELVDSHVDLGDAPGRANPGDKLLTLVASALAGSDCIDDADVFRTGGTTGAIGCAVKAPSTLGTFLRSFRWGHVHSRPGSIASPAVACLTAPTAPDPSTRLPNRPTESHRPGPRLSSPACRPADPAPAPLPRTAIGAPNDNQWPPPAPFIGIERGPSRPTALTPCSNPKAAPHRWIRV